MSRYIASVSTCDQVGPDSFQNVLHTRIVQEEDTVAELVGWARILTASRGKPGQNPQLLITVDLQDESG